MLAETAGTPVRWVNTHEFDTTGITGGLMLYPVALGAAVVQFHRSLLMTNFYVEGVTVSTYADDGAPYNPDTFYARTVLLRGLRSAGTNNTAVLPLTNTVLIKRMVDTGREGSMLLRGMLTEADIQSDPLTGSVTFTDLGTLTDNLSQAYTAMATAAHDAGADMALLSGPDGATSRLVVGLKLKGISSKQLRNKRTMAGSGGGLGGLFDGLVTQYGSAVVSQMVNYLLESGGTVPLLP
jgi:hypothetical protein